MRTLDIGLVCQNVVRRDGQGRVMLELTRALLARGHRVTVYAHRLDEELAGAVRLRRIPRAPGPQLIDDLLFLVLATVAVRRAAHDVVCVLGPTALPRAPFVYNAQFSHRGWRRAWTRATRPGLYHRVHALVVAALETLCARRADRIISSTAALARDVLPGAERKAVVVPDGVDLGEFAPPTAAERASAREVLGLEPEHFAIGFFGGWSTPRKGLDPLLRALALGSGCERLLLAADGPRNALQELFDELGVADRVVLAGFETPQRILAACDAVAVPSLYEPFSLVALEAAASGLPVVMAARAGAAPILNGAALLVDEPTDAVELRAALDRLHDPEERRRRGSRGRVVTADLAWSAVFERAALAVEEVVFP